MADAVKIKDIHMDENSVKASTPIQDSPLEGEITDLGVLPVPVIANIEAMIRLLEEYQDDTRFVMAIIRASTIDFSPVQKNIIDKIEQEYAAWIDPLNTDVNLFDEYVIQLRDDFFYQESRESDFYEEQVRIYAGVYRALTRFPFPYSDKQLELLESFRAEIDWATGDPTRMADIALMEDLQCFLRLMEKGDHTNSNKFYVNCTVEYYVQEIVDELFYLEHEESTRRIPASIPEGAIVNVATYVKEQLVWNFNGCHFDTHVGLYHVGLSEIYTRLVEIFELSGLPLSDEQGSLLLNIKKEIGNAVREQSTGRYEDLHLGFYGFIDSLRRDHPELEKREDGGYKVVDEEGSVARIIKKMIHDLDELQKVAEDHHQSFYDYSSAIPEITKTILNYVTRIYPLDHAEPITVILPNGFYASVLCEEWFKEPRE